jgi:hypothetical protein
MGKIDQIAKARSAVVQKGTGRFILSACSAFWLKMGRDHVLFF